jgi:formate-dependent nitrite reductase membrane component NrfD
MNPFVVDPEWGWWIILYFFLGGIAAGAYFTATIIDLIGHEEDRELARMGYWLSFPLVAICGLLLILDLGQPLRFWHMLFKSEIVHEAISEGWPWSGESWALMVQAPLIKYWSPMSVGSWALLIFGICSFLSVLGSLWPAGRLSWLFRRSWLGRAVQWIGCFVGFFIAAYTGALLTATNQPIWSDTTWLAALFLTSAASTGIALLILLARWQNAAPPEAIHRLEQADLWVMGLEVIVFMVFLASLDTLLWPLLSTWNGLVMVLGTLLLGILVPVAIHLRIGVSGIKGALAAALFALVGGFLMRYGILGAAPELLAQGPAALAGGGFSPEQDRKPGKSLGADPLNRRDPDDPDGVTPRGKGKRSD